MGTFGYHVLYRKQVPGPMVKVIATWVEIDQPLRAVLWSVPKQK